MTHGAPGTEAESFVRRLVTLTPGESRRFFDADWVDAIVLVATGAVEVESLSGARHTFARGDLLWLAGQPVRALHNTRKDLAVLVALSRPGSAV